ncbi:MAG: methylamine utilization protein [Planctomycetaceae bacterium]
MITSITRSLVVAAVCCCGLAAHGDEWGSIKGRFVFGGDAPTAAELKADKDIEVCGKHKLMSEELVVGVDNGVADVVVFVRDKDVKVNPDLKAAETVVLDNKNCRFEPHVLFVQTGQQLVIKNSDPVGHNSNITPFVNPASNPLIPAGGDTKITFTKEEPRPIPVTCNVHPWMKAWLVVRSNPYAAISSPDGSFEIKGVPVGDVELQIGHEKGYVAGSTTTQGKTDKKGRIKVKVVAGGTDLGDITVPSAIFTK